jgi:hypothetical protein
MNAAAAYLNIVVLMRLHPSRKLHAAPAILIFDIPQRFPATAFRTGGRADALAWRQEGRARLVE